MRSPAPSPAPPPRDSRCNGRLFHSIRVRSKRSHSNGFSLSDKQDWNGSVFALQSCNPCISPPLSRSERRM
jgi:hypothetical protein